MTYRSSAIKRQRGLFGPVSDQLSQYWDNPPAANLVTDYEIRRPKPSDDPAWIFSFVAPSDHEWAQHLANMEAQP